MYHASLRRRLSNICVLFSEFIHSIPKCSSLYAYAIPSNDADFLNLQHFKSNISSLPLILLQLSSFSYCKNHLLIYFWQFIDESSFLFLISSNSLINMNMNNTLISFLSVNTKIILNLGINHIKNLIDDRTSYNFLHKNIFLE